MSSERGRRARGGFTLLEVLAAVAVLGILYTVLADVAIRGIRAEGVSKRRLEASLLADEQLSRIELGIVSGSVPVVGIEELDEGDYRITTTVAPLEMPFLPPPEPGEEELSAVALLTGEGLAGDPPVRAIEIRVAWMEGEQEQEVVRTTYAYDLLGIDQLLPTPGEGGSEAGFLQQAAEELGIGPGEAP